MQDIKRELYDGVFHLWDMHPTKTEGRYGPAGTLYTFDGPAGNGEYWTYFRGGFFAVNAFHLHFRTTGAMRYRHPEHLTIACYDEVHGITHAPGGAPSAGSACAYIGAQGGTYLGSYKKGADAEAVSITVSPAYYRDYLQRRFGPLEDLRRDFALVDGRRDLPELFALFKTIKGYRGRGMAADLFYEGAVAEAVSLVLDRAHRLQTEHRRPLPPDDRRTIDELCTYIAANLGSDLSAETLAAHAYIGQTKLKRLFKEVTGMTPGAYVTVQRMERADMMLLNSDLPIEQIAAKVGYRSPAAFSTAFRRHFGMSPQERRRNSV